MKDFEKEVEENFERFCRSSKKAAQSAASALTTRRDKFLKSYRRIVSLQAWRSEILESTISAGSLAFFLEAQNDALTSHVLASLGIWRSALKSLRSCIENVLFSLYYKDHPVELQLWESGRHMIPFSAVQGYFGNHPALSGFKHQAVGLDVVSAEYSILSRAVHASSRSFRMSVEEIGVQLWSSDVARLGAWETREVKTLTAVNRLLMSLFREQLAGARLPNLRKAISLVIPASKHRQIKDDFGISLFKK